MEIMFIIILIIFVFLAALIIILVKKILKIFFFISILLLVFVLSFGIFIYQDVVDIKENFVSSNKLFLLEDNNEILTGIIIIGDETVFIDENQVNTYTNYLQEKDYESLLGDNYKFMLVKLDILNELKDEYEMLDETVTKEELFTIFRSEEPYKELAGKNPEGKVTINDQEIDAANKVKFKGLLFGVVLANDLIKSKNPFKMLIYYKKNYIEIYPETILFKFVKSIPTSFVSKISAKVTINIEKLKEKI